MNLSAIISLGGSWRGRAARGAVALGVLAATGLGTAAPALALCGGTCQPGPYPRPYPLPTYLPNLTIGMAATPSPVAANGTLTYTLTVNNVGRGAAYGVDVRDLLPSGVTYESASGSGFTCAPNGSVVDCSGGRLLAGGSATITLAVRAPGAAGTITNNATVNPDQTIVETNYADNSASLSTTVNAPPPTPTTDLTIDLASTTSGSQITYTMHVRNLGTTAATNVRTMWLITDTDWFQGTYSGDSGFTCYVPAEYMDQEVECVGGSVAPGATATLTVTTPLPPYTGTTYEVRATVDPYNQIPETNENNNTATMYVY